ncbi:plasmid pRiA4b ORF-3 family protein [Pseudogemmobacter hezensis]|uniref:plasmid pRiA4b ORF-3 family protein n=1 Tax=Pseudogemmobacter hezensis TaxID=2737662 RepID=UPI0020A62B70|nr:plasmid pRiA4b ORF-3 family protein [Pseudogemmobacter hezensis]
MYQPVNAVRLHVALAEIEPPIWRRLVVPTDWTLGKLHLVLQAAFSWTDSHLHEIRIGGLRYGDTGQLEDSFGGVRIFDCSEVRLADFTGQELAFSYLYDFGDDWTHVIRIEEWLSLDPLPSRPCPTQSRYCDAHHLRISPRHCGDDKWFSHGGRHAAGAPRQNCPARPMWFQAVQETPPQVVAVGRVVCVRMSLQV